MRGPRSRWCLWLLFVWLVGCQSTSAPEVEAIGIVAAITDRGVRVCFDEGVSFHIGQLLVVMRPVVVRHHRHANHLRRVAHLQLTGIDDNHCGMATLLDGDALPGDPVY